MDVLASIVSGAADAAAEIGTDLEYLYPWSQRADTSSVRGRSLVMFRLLHPILKEVEVEIRDRFSNRSYENAMIAPLHRRLNFGESQCLV